MSGGRAPARPCGPHPGPLPCAPAAASPRPPAPPPARPRPFCAPTRPLLRAVASSHLPSRAALRDHLRPHRLAPAPAPPRLYVGRWPGRRADGPAGRQVCAQPRSAPQRRPRPHLLSGRNLLWVGRRRIGGEAAPREATLSRPGSICAAARGPEPAWPREPALMLCLFMVHGTQCRAICVCRTAKTHQLHAVALALLSDFSRIVTLVSR